MKRIPLTQGQFALVSDCDYAYLAQWKWCFSQRTNRRDGYAIRRGSGPTRATIYMHKVIATRKGFSGEVDHRNQNKLDNQRRNLRPATRSQNKGNCGPRSDNQSGFKGVYWDLDRQKWAASIRCNGKTQHLGLFPATKIGNYKAACAYNRAARKHFGRYAALNPV
jgi:hypothetical protein